MPLSASHDKEGRAFYSFSMERLSVEKELSALFEEMMNKLLKE